MGKNCSCVRFVLVQEKDGTQHDFCDKCTTAFVIAHPGGIQGVWDVPDPMGG